jgi:predicted RNA-binding protein with PUA-like domain
VNLFLLKTEPSVYSYYNLEKEKHTVWDGVTSPGGLFQIKTIKKNDLAFIYHTGSEKAVTGISKIISNPYIQPKQNNTKLLVFDVAPLHKLKNPVTLQQIKADNRFANSRILNEPRLSVQPISVHLWNAVLELAGYDSNFKYYFK